MKGLVVLLVIGGVLLGLPSLGYTEEETKKTGIGFQICPLGCGVSLRHWFTNFGFQLIGGGEIDDEYRHIIYGGGILYKVSDKEKIDAYFGAGFGGWDWEEEEWWDFEEEKDLTYKERGFGGQVVFGIEYLIIEALGCNLEIGFFYGEGEEKKDGREETHKGGGAGFIGLGMHYYF